MNVLAFDTCFGACSAAVLLQDGVEERLIWRYEEMTTGQAERLIPMIGEVLQEVGRKLQSLDAIVVTEGPGTFTGTRIGIAAARGFALASKLPIRATTSLHVMARRAARELGGVPADHGLAVCVDARAGQVFVQLFEPTSVEPLNEAAVLAPEAAAGLSPGQPLFCVGSGAAIVAEAAARLGRSASSQLPKLQPDARDLARMAATLAVRSPLVPLYLRPPDAKPQIGKSLPRA